MQDKTISASNTPPSVSQPPAKLSWLAAWRVYLEPASLRMFTLGFSAGLPLLLVLGTLSFWLREAGIDRTTIGYLSWVGLAYGFKWVWAPLVDRMHFHVCVVDGVFEEVEGEGDADATPRISSP